jgi:hypothetical protein
MDVLRRLCAFTAELQRLLAARTPEEFEAAWTSRDLEGLGRRALALARRAESLTLAPVLAELDGTLLAVLARSRTLPDPRIETFRIPQLERWQHGTAAALVGVRWGVAGLRTVIADPAAPLGRRYFAFLALAQRHPESAWPLFERYLLTPGAHHAFVAVAAEAARYYDGRAGVLLELFERIRGDQMLRRFLGPKILESLYVLGDPATLPLFRELVVAGHTDRDPERCEVTRALVAVRKLTGTVPPSAKFPDGDEPRVRQRLDDAERRFDAERDELTPVVVI